MNTTTSAPLDLADELVIRPRENFGLYNGKMGLCMYHFLLSGMPGNSEYHIEAARGLLDEISDNTDKITDMNFGNGLAGIGWGIEWVIGNRYVDAHTDEILGDLDDEIYRSVMYARSPDISLENGALGKAMYFYKRLTSPNPGPARERSLAHLECLVFLTDEIHDGVFDEDAGLLRRCMSFTENTGPELTNIAQVLIFLTKLINDRVNPEITEKTICNIVSFIYNLDASNLHPQSIEGYTYLLHALDIAGTKLNDRQWVKKAADLQQGIRSFHPGVYRDSSILQSLWALSGEFPDLNRSWQEAWLIS